MSGSVENFSKSLLRFFTAGAVDDGKSTLIGRLLIDSKAVFKDHLLSLEKSKRSGQSEIDLSHLTDGLKAEREQGITIDVAYRYFSTTGREFILADAPGHLEYTKNMATAASQSELVLLLIDAKRGITEQTKRHSFIAAAFGVSQFLVVVNKMDAVEYSQEVFKKIQNEFSEATKDLTLGGVEFVPVSALRGDNVVSGSPRMPWHRGPTVLSFLEEINVQPAPALNEFRFPVQLVLKSGEGERLYAGDVASGAASVGDEISVLPSQKTSRIRSIETMNGNLESAAAGAAVAIRLDDELDISRGDLMVQSKQRPNLARVFEADLLWLSNLPLHTEKRFLIRQLTRWGKVRVDKIHYEFDMGNYRQKATSMLKANSVGRVSISSMSDLYLDDFQRNRKMGSFLLVDELTNQTLAAGLVREIFPLAARGAEQRHRTATYWLTGLSGSGKSTIAKALQTEIRVAGKEAVILDGDEIRAGINQDLDFSDEARRENIRRVAEMAKLINASGVSVICSLISPKALDRMMAKRIIGEQDFREIFVDTPLSLCEARDPKGLYKKARAGLIPQFTGVSSPYESPANPWMTVTTSETRPEDLARAIVERGDGH